MNQEIIIIEDDSELTVFLKEVFIKEKEYSISTIKSTEFKSKNIVSDLIVINEDFISDDIINICSLIRNENQIIPIIVVSSNIEKEHRIDILKSNVQYFIKSPIDKEYIYYTIKNLMGLMSCNRKVSPLTGLPGNLQIQVELRKRILKKQEFAILYFDLDNFKAYNDTYGFMNGDEIIKFTARTIYKTVNSYLIDNAFVGHIGGDDFVSIISVADYETICKDIIKTFDNNVKQYFTKEDVEKGYLEVANRQGIIEQFPLTSISIGVVIVKPGEYSNPLEIGEVGAQTKHIAKTKQGSAYAINRRKFKK